MRYPGEQKTIDETMAERFQKQVDDWNFIVGMRGGELDEETKEVWNKLQKVKKYLVKKGLLK